jgi:tetratricopeptide (TPR) repeat protein
MTRSFFPFAFLILFFFTGINSHSQSVSDTLNLAKQLRGEGKIQQSYSLLKKAYAHHPDELNVAWLTAQTAFWANRIGKSGKLYEKAVQSNPKNLYLQLDYAKMLVNTGNFKKAVPLLDNYLAYDSANAQALTALSRIFFWRCRYTEADRLVTKALKSDPKYPEASSLYKEIVLARAPYLKIGAGYGSDDQPMQTLSTVVEAGFYLHALSALHFTFQAPVFIRDGKTANAFIFQAGNISFISRANLTIGLDAGVVKFPDNNHYALTVNLDIDKIILRHLVLSVSAQRNPYFSTRSSIDSVVIQNHLSGSIGWNNRNSWNGEMGVDAFTYPFDHNLTYSGYAWVFGPPMKFSVFRLQLGYGYNYSNSKKSRYGPEKSLPDILSGYDANSKIEGVYNPYFTPNDQQVHSLLLAFTCHPLKWMDLSLNANAGFYATTQVPYLYLDKDATDSTILRTGFAPAGFNPITVRLQALMKLSDVVHLQVDYSFMSTYFYSSHYAGVGLNIRFPHENKTR